MPRRAHRRSRSQGNGARGRAPAALWPARVRSCHPPPEPEHLFEHRLELGHIRWRRRSSAGPNPAHRRASFGVLPELLSAIGRAPFAAHAEEQRRVFARVVLIRAERRPAHERVIRDAAAGPRSRRHVRPCRDPGLAKLGGAPAGEAVAVDLAQFEDAADVAKVLAAEHGGYLVEYLGYVAPVCGLAERLAEDVGLFGVAVELLRRLPDDAALVQAGRVGALAQVVLVALGERLEPPAEVLLGLRRIVGSTKHRAVD